ncbi:Zinc finger MYND domain-containing protein 10 [Sparganum proliferum]
MPECDSRCILYPSEAEAYIESLTFYDFDTYGCEVWYRQHAYLDKLNMQAVVSARSGGDEFIKEFVLTHQKIPFLIRDLISTEIWKQKVLKRVLKRMPDDLPSFPIYAHIQHELVLVNLLETVTYHIDAVEALADVAIDLCDWCHRALCRLVSLSATEERKTELKSLKNEIREETNEEELRRQLRVTSFEISMKAVSLSRHLIQHCCDRSTGTSSLPLSVGRRLLQTHDFLILLCQLIELAPWNCEAPKDASNKLLRYQWHETGVWIPETDEARWMPVSRTEGQVWLGIYQLVFSELTTSVHYDLAENQRRQALLRLRPYLTEVLIDVLPVLCELRRFLEQFAVSESVVYRADSKSSASALAQMCQIEMVAENWETLLKKYKGKWDEEAEAFLQRIRSKEGQQAAKRAATRWSDAFTEENVEAIFGSSASEQTDAYNDSFQHPLFPPARCVVCGEMASKRCSRCRQEWYCRPAICEHAAFSNCTVGTVRKSTIDWFHGARDRYGGRSKRRDSNTKLPVSTCTAETYLTQSTSKDTIPTSDLDGPPNMSPEEA